MDWLSSHLLSVLIFLPAIGALLVVVAPTRNAARWTAVTFAAITFCLSLSLIGVFKWHGSPQTALYAYQSTSNTFGVVQLVERADWIPTFNIQYLVGVDGLSLPMVILTTFIFLLAAIASWKIEKMAKGYFILFLLLQSGLLGVFLSLDFFLFYVFFEISLLPMYFLIGIWGGPRREYAAIKFFLYTLLGSIALLIAMIGTYLASKQVIPGGTFDLIQLAEARFHLPVSPHAIMYFVLLLIGFMVKIPAVPLHTWLPDAHVEAPTPISMILAAVLLKMGGYGLFRIAYPLYPEAAQKLWLLVAVIGVVSIIYGALCALGQTDFKRLVAYSSVSHMGLVTLGAAMMTNASVNGAIFMMIAHGITSAMLFFLVGVIYDRAHHRDLTRLGGLASSMPAYWGFSIVGFAANMGLPALCGFVGEVMVLIGTFMALNGNQVLIAHGYATRRQIVTIAIIACFTIVLSAAYMLWTLQRIFMGPQKPEYNALPDLNQNELLVLTPLAIMTVFLGILPMVFVFAFTDTTVAGLMKIFGLPA